MSDVLKIIFLDFDGVMDTAYYDHVLNRAGLPGNDKYGVVFDPDCVKNLGYIVEQTGADIVVSSSWKYIMANKDLYRQIREERTALIGIKCRPFSFSPVGVRSFSYRCKTFHLQLKGRAAAAENLFLGNNN